MKKVCGTKIKVIPRDVNGCNDVNDNHIIATIFLAAIFDFHFNPNILGTHPSISAVLAQIVDTLGTAKVA